MNQDKESISRIYRCFIFSLCLFCFIFLLPNGVSKPSWDFIQIATAGSWNRFFDWASAWCSVKILLLCVGLFLMFEGSGLMLTRYGRKGLARLFFYSSLLPCFGFIFGGYYLFKALL